MVRRGRRSALGEPERIIPLSSLPFWRGELDEAAEAVAPDYVARLRATFRVDEPEPEPGAVVDSWTVYTRNGATLHKIHADGEYTVEPLA